MDVLRKGSIILHLKIYFKSNLFWHRKKHVELNFSTTSPLWCYCGLERSKGSRPVLLSSLGTWDSNVCPAYFPGSNVYMLCTMSKMLYPCCFLYSIIVLVWPIRLLGEVNSKWIVTRQEPGPAWVCIEPAIVRGFLTSCRKDFTTRVQVTIRIHLLKLGTVKQGRA